MLADFLSDAVRNIERYEKESPESYGPLAERLRGIKLEMLLITWWLDISISPRLRDLYTPADYDWLRQECLKRANDNAPHEVRDVFLVCATELRIKKFGQ